jgi:arsenite methyltransferase
VKTVQVFDKPMCCSTGVCGPDVDPVLPRFAADLEWLKSQGHRVERFNLAQQPDAFLAHQEVLQQVSALGTDCLPIVVVDGRIVAGREYPTREQLSNLVGPSALPALSVLPTGTSQADGGCCGGSSCC